MSEWTLKRFWSEATVHKVVDGYAIQLDGRPIKTPAKQTLIVPTQALAHEIASEWQIQGDAIDVNTMPFTRTANSALDKVAVQFNEVASLIAAYGENDLLCYRADSPFELVQRQAQAWDPLLEWLYESFNAHLKVGSGVMHVPQDSQSVDILRQEVFKLNAFELAAFHDIVSISGTLVGALAVTYKHYSADDVWELSRIDDTWQQEQWGIDEDANIVSLIKKEQFKIACRFFDSLGQ